MNLLTGSPVWDLELTNVFKLPLIPGPASDYSTIYSALKVAHCSSSCASGEGTKIIISVDLDLYKKLYMLVNDQICGPCSCCVLANSILFSHI